MQKNINDLLVKYPWKDYPLYSHIHLSIASLRAFSELSPFLEKLRDTDLKSFLQSKNLFELNLQKKCYTTYSPEQLLLP